MFMVLFLIVLMIQTDSVCFIFCRWGIIFALFVPYFCDIPRVAVTHIWGVPFTGKSVAYVIGLQVNEFIHKSTA